MIPPAHITAWRAQAPWPDDAQVEQDLVLSRALVEVFRQPTLARELAFRGGTALHKLLLNPAGRYSEDIDLIQVKAGPIGPLIDELRGVLDPWLGEPRRNFGPSVATLTYRFETTMSPVQTMRLKVEINTREHFAVLGYRTHPHAVENPWFSGAADLRTFEPEELLGTKLRALYQRRKGRDLFDLASALRSLELNDQRIVDCCLHYLGEEDLSVSRAEFEANLAAKMTEPAFVEDVLPLLGSAAEYDAVGAAALVVERLVAKLPGAPWQGTLE